MPRLPPRPTLFPYTTLFRSGGQLPQVERRLHELVGADGGVALAHAVEPALRGDHEPFGDVAQRRVARRSEEHTSELQSHVNLVCRLLLEKKKKKKSKQIKNQ